MTDPQSPTGGADRVDTALAALARYRQRRALDGAGHGGAECLLQYADTYEELAAHHRRRIELVERAVDEGWIERADAEKVYDIAREEGLEPAFAFELVRCGVAVCGPEEVGPQEPTAARTSVVEGGPEWLGRPVTTEEALRERRLRASFRRLRGLLERYHSPEEALVAFAREPDVGECEY